jgi:hypothetical protein
MRSEFYRNRISTALTVKRKSELVARMSFEHMGLKTSAWENCTQCVHSRSEINVPGQRASQQSVRCEGTISDVGVRGYYGARSNIGLSACAHHGLWFFPVIRLNVSRNLTPTGEILFEPHKLFPQSVPNAPGAEVGTGDRP